MRIGVIGQVGSYHLETSSLRKQCNPKLRCQQEAAAALSKYNNGNFTNPAVCCREISLSWSTQKKMKRNGLECRAEATGSIRATAASIEVGSSKRSPSSLEIAGASIVETMFQPVLDAGPPDHSGRRVSKVTVVGVGNVGMACAQTIITQDLADQIALVDISANKLRGEMLDLQHAAAFLPRADIVADTDYAITAHSDICIVTAGARQREGESRLALVERNVSFFKQIIPELVKYSPNAILLIISNPVDALTFVAWKLSGFRFRWLMANRLQVNAHNVHGYIVGEHGDTSVPLWSSVNVGGVPMIQFLQDKGILVEKDTLEELHRYLLIPGILSFFLFHLNECFNSILVMEFFPFI
jgi:L-lactate dehydrogenase